MAAPERSGHSDGMRLDPTLRASIAAVAASATALAFAGAIAYGARAALGVAIGGAIATLNLYVFAKVGRAFLVRQGHTAPWAVVAVLKLVALLGGVWLILRSGVVTPLSLAVGYGALPVGITLGSVFGPKPPDEPFAAPSGSPPSPDVVDADPAPDAPDDDAPKAT